MKDFDWQVKFDVVIVSMATETIEYNLKISVWLSLHKIRSLDFPTYLHTAYYKWFSSNLGRHKTMVKWTNAGGQTK